MPITIFLEKFFYDLSLLQIKSIRHGISLKMIHTLTMLTHNLDHTIWHNG